MPVGGGEHKVTHGGEAAAADIQSVKDAGRRRRPVRDAVWPRLRSRSVDTVARGGRHVARAELRFET